MNRKIFISFTLILFTLNLSYSQLSIGFHGGATLGNGKYIMKVDFYDQKTEIVYPKIYNHEKDGTSIISFSFGGIIETKLYSFLYLQSEFNIVDHRFSLEDHYRTFGGEDCEGGSWAMKYSFKYIEIPVILKAKLKVNSFIPFIFAGAGIGFLCKSGQSFDSWDEQVSILDVTKHEQPFAILGIGSEYLLNDFFNLFFTFRYSNSLVDIAKSNIVYFKPHNYDIMLGVKTNILNY